MLFVPNGYRAWCTRALSIGSPCTCVAIPLVLRQDGVSHSIQQSSLTTTPSLATVRQILLEAMHSVVLCSQPFLLSFWPFPSNGISAGPSPFEAI